jgi:hypothetical protein
MLSSRLLAFWQFGSAGMLLWGLAAAVPILIHLWSRRRHREESWAAMAFLLAALRKNARRIQLEQWILLAVRAAILLLFALALANPQFAALSSSPTASEATSTHLVLVIDGSFSMDFREGGQSRFAAAREQAGQIIERGEEGNCYTLLLMSDPPKVIISQPAFDRSAVLTELKQLQLPHAGASLPATLAEVEVILRRTAELLSGTGRPIRQRVCFFTDLQQVTWSEVNSTDCRERLGRLTKLAALEVFDLGKPGMENHAVAQLAINSSAGGLAIAHAPVQIRAEIQSFARQDRPVQAVELLVDGQRIADERVNVPAGGRATVAVSHRFDSPGDHVIEARLSNDALPLDDYRWLSVPVREAIRVMCIGGRLTETRHVILALAPQTQAAGPIEITAAPESSLLQEDLSQFDCLVLCNIARFSKGEAAALHRYVTSGGGLLLFVGDQVQPANYNQVLAEEPANRVLPGTLHEQAPVKLDGYRLDPLEYRHPIVAPFRGFPESGLLTTPIWKYLQVKPLNGSTVAIGLDNGEPLIVEGPVGQGRCILVATAASPDSLDRSIDPPTPWTALPSWPSFPPLIHEMLRFLLTSRRTEHNLLVGDELTGTVNSVSGDPSVMVSGPHDIRAELSLAPFGGKSRWSFGATTTSGAYSVRHGNEVRRFAVNVDPRESDLARFDSELLPSQLRRSSQVLSSEPPGVGPGNSFLPFQLLLGAVILLLLADPLIAWQFGKGRA